MHNCWCPNGNGKEKGLREPRIGAPADKQPFACSLNPLMSFHLPHLAWSLIDKSWLSNPQSEAEGGARIGGPGRGFRIPSKAPKRALNVCPSSRAQCLLQRPKSPGNSLCQYLLLNFSIQYKDKSFLKWLKAKKRGFGTYLEQAKNSFCSVASPPQRNMFLKVRGQCNCFPAKDPLMGT